MTEPPRLKVLDTFTIAGIGLCYACEGEPGLDPRTLLGQRVRVSDAITGTVRRVETYAVPDATSANFSVSLSES